MLDPEILEVLRGVPRIFRACHGRHVRRPSTSLRLTDRESMILGHFDPGVPVTPGRLARHLGIASSSLSPLLGRLEGRGLLSRAPRTGDRRIHELRLTAAGERAMVETSALDPERVRAVLARLPAAVRRRALEGLRLLADAAREAEVAWRSSR